MKVLLFLCLIFYFFEISKCSGKDGSSSKLDIKIIGPPNKARSASFQKQESRKASNTSPTKKTTSFEETTYPISFKGPLYPLQMNITGNSLSYHSLSGWFKKIGSKTPNIKLLPNIYCWIKKFADFKVWLSYRFLKSLSYVKEFV